MKYFSTFTGIGGFEIGIQNAIESNRKARKANADTGHSSNDTSDPLQEWGQSAACVGYSEIDKYAISVFERHYPNVRNYGDITKINAEELPDFDCLVGGFPCQAFSIAGNRHGFNDTRGTLFFDLARILRAKQPRYFVFENVKGLLSHDKGNTFRTIINTIDELGYDCQWQVLNSKNHGVPQNRDRVIIVGHLRGTPRPEVFPIGGADEEDTEPSEDRGVFAVKASHRNGLRFTEESPTLDTMYKKGFPGLGQDRAGAIVTVVNSRHDHQRVYDTDGISPTIGTMQRGNAQPKVFVPEATALGYAEATVGDSINLSVINSKTRRGRVGKGIAQTVDTGMQQHTLTGDLRIRRLTPKECERLQAFPDDWTKYAANGTEISDTQRYKMCGNAVTTNVIRDVFERIMA